jgi:hypothetical protein
MKNLRAKNLQLAGIELVMPTVLCIDGRASKGRPTLTIGYATGYVDTIVAPLAAEWLSRQIRRRFGEHGRGAEGDIAVEAFYDKLASEFTREMPFLAAIVSPHHAASLGFGIDQTANGAVIKPHDYGRRRVNGDVLSRFMDGAGLARWMFAGPVHAFINPKTGAAQVAFEPLPGGIELTDTDKPDSSGARLCKRANEAVAWYGFGVPIRDPAEIVLMLRNEIAEARNAQAHARRTAHV